MRRKGRSDPAYEVGEAFRRAYHVTHVKQPLHNENHENQIQPNSPCLCVHVCDSDYTSVHGEIGRERLCQGQCGSTSIAMQGSNELPCCHAFRCDGSDSFCKQPFELILPNPPSGHATLRKGSAVPWSVCSEDGEVGGKFGASGLISSCRYSLNGTNDCHETNAVIVLSVSKAQYVRSEQNYWNHFRVLCSCKFMKPGIHTIEYHFNNCEDCGSSPPATPVEYYETGPVNITTSVFIRNHEFICGNVEQTILGPPLSSLPEDETITFVAEGINPNYPCCSTRVTKHETVQ